uniref:Uncharacterized protein n=1 Tax=Meloidogyne incognita TaxID=6306 RepID=A0A914NEN5_MELIC
MDPRHLWVQSLQRGLELELNGALNEAEDASRAAKENNRILTGVSNWLDRRAELQRAAAEIDRRRRLEHAKVHTEWKGKFSELEKEMREKQTALEQEFHNRIDSLEEWRRIEDLNVEREWNQKRSALESSELISAQILNNKEREIPKIEEVKEEIKEEK